MTLSPNCFKKLFLTGYFLKKLRMKIEKCGSLLSTVGLMNWHFNLEFKTKFFLQLFFIAFIVRYLTKRFITEYDPLLGEYYITWK